MQEWETATTDTNMPPVLLITQLACDEGKGRDPLHALSQTGPFRKRHQEEESGQGEDDAFEAGGPPCMTGVAAMWGGGGLILPVGKAHPAVQAHLYPPFSLQPIVRSQPNMLRLEAQETSCLWG